MDLIIPLLLSLGLTAITVAYLNRRLPADEADWVTRLLVIGVVLRVAAATLFLFLPETRIFHEDAAGYEQRGVYIARMWAGEVPPIDHFLKGHENRGYFYFAGVLCFVFGRFEGLPSFFNTWLGATTGVVVYLLARMLFHQLVARRAMLLLILFPSNILWSSIAAKDTAMMFLVVLTLYFIVQIRQRYTFGAMVGIVTSMVAIYLVRFYIFFVVVAAIAGSFTLFSRRLGMTVGRQISIFLVLAAVMAGFGLSRQATSSTSMLSFQRASQLRSGLAVSAKSGFAVEADVSTPTKAIAFLPIGVAYLLLSPFPWQLTSVRAAGTMPEMLVWWALFPAMIRGLLFALRRERERLAPVFVFTVLLTLAYATFHGNVGVIFRQRTQITVFLYIFVALGFYLKRCAAVGLAPDVLLADHEATPAPVAAPTPSSAAA